MQISKMIIVFSINFIRIRVVFLKESEWAKDNSVGTPNTLKKFKTEIENNASEFPRSMKTNFLCKLPK